MNQKIRKKIIFLRKFQILSNLFELNLENLQELGWPRIANDL